MTHTNPELTQIQVHGMSRQAFLVRGALTTGALYGAGAVAPWMTNAFAASGSGDIDILNFALTLEYLESAFYTKAVKTVTLSSANKKLAVEIRDNEDDHVTALTKAIKSAGGTPVAAPGVDFGAAFASEKSFLKLAQTFEDTGVSAYNGAGPSISDPSVLSAAGSIVQVEARHAALIRLANGVTPAPDSFDKSLDKAAVLKAVKGFITG